MKTKGRIPFTSLIKIKNRFIALRPKLQNLLGDSASAKALFEIQAYVTLPNMKTNHLNLCLELAIAKDGRNLLYSIRNNKRNRYTYPLRNTSFHYFLLLLDCGGLAKHVVRGLGVPQVVAKRQPHP